MPIAIQPIYKAVTNKIASLDVLARLYGNEGDQIPSGELFAAAARRNMLVVKSNQHQVFGTFSGRFLVDNLTTPIEIHDLPGFAEKVFNRW